MSMLLKNTTNFLVRIAKKIDVLLYPHRCPGCNILLESGADWCTKCRISLMHAINQRYCPRCASTLGPHQEYQFSTKECPLCKKFSLPLNNICRLGIYEQALSKAIINFKYNHDIYGLNILAKMLSEIIKEQNWFDEIEAFCPIPAHWTRRIHRGFNQSAVLAERISAFTSKPVILLLKKVRPTPSQTGLSFAQRKLNIQGAFEVAGKWNLASSKICLIDDVMTSGSTLAEAARTLKRAGAKKIFAAVLARAERIAS